MKFAVVGLPNSLIYSTALTWSDKAICSQHDLKLFYSALQSNSLFLQCIMFFNENLKDMMMCIYYSTLETCYVYFVKSIGCKDMSTGTYRL